MEEKSEGGASVDLSKISDDDLEALVRGESLPEGEEAEEPTGSSEADESPESEGVEKPDDEQPEEIAAKEEEGEEEVDETEARLRLLEAEIEATKGDAQRWEKIAQRESGRNGNLLQQLKELKEMVGELDKRRSQDPLADDDDYEERPSKPRRRSTPSSSRESDPTRDYVVTEAATRAAQSWGSKNSDVVVTDENNNQDFHPEFKKILEDYQSDITNVLDSQDPIAVSQETTRILQSAKSRFVAEQRRRELEALRSRSADSADSLKRKKRAAAPVKSTDGAQPERAVSRDLSSLSDEELEELVRQTSARV